MKYVNSDTQSHNVIEIQFNKKIKNTHIDKAEFLEMKMIEIFRR